MQGGQPAGTLAWAMDPERVEKLRRDLDACAAARAGLTEAQLQMSQLLGAAGERAFRRDHLQPGHFTASAFVLGPDRASLLLIFHKKLRLWLQPGGHFELDDLDHVAAARREVSEEVGLRDLELLSSLYDLDVHAIPENAREGQHLHFDLRVLLLSQTPEVRASDEVEAARYFSLRELIEAPDQLGPPSASLPRGATDESVVRVARQLLASRP